MSSRRLILEALGKIESYFDDIDKEVSIRLLRGVSPLETTLTDELLAAMDGVGRDRENSIMPAYELSRTLDGLKERGHGKLALPAKFLRADVAAFDHGGAYEAFASHADVGIVINIKSDDDSRPARRAAYIFQAKRLFSRRFCENGALFDETAIFRSSRTRQKEQLIDVQKHIGAQHVRYLYYMPRRDYLKKSPEEQEQMLVHCAGPPRRTWPDSEGPENGGIWVGRVEDARDKLTAADVHAREADATLTLTAFLLSHFRQAISVREPAVHKHELGPYFRYENDLGASRLAFGIAEGKKWAATELNKLLKVTSRQPAELLPAASLSLTIKAPARLLSPIPSLSDGRAAAVLRRR